MENKIRKTKLVGHGYGGMEVHYESPVSRGGLDVINTNHQTDPVAVPVKVIDQLQRLKYYFMILFSMMEQDDEMFLSELGDQMDYDIKDNDSNSDRYAALMAVSQKVFVTKLEIDEDNQVIISADYEMLDERIRNYTTVKIGPDDEFPRYYDMIRVAREAMQSIYEYIFSAQNKKDILADVKEVLIKLMPDRGDEIKDMDQGERVDLYREYLESKGHVVISQEDFTDKDPGEKNMDEIEEDAVATGKSDTITINHEDEGDEEIPEVPGSDSDEKVENFN